MFIIIVARYAGMDGYYCDSLRPTTFDRDEAHKFGSYDAAIWFASTISGKTAIERYS